MSAKPIPPKIAKFHSNGDFVNLQSTFAQANKLLFLLSLTLLIFILSFGKNILSLFGEEFENYNHVLSIIVAGQFIASVTGINVFLLQMTGYQRQIMFNMLISVCITIPLGIYLVKNFQIVGAALMTFISLTMINLLSCFTVYKKFGFNPVSLFNN